MITPAFSRLFGNRSKTVIGMLHVPALPGTPRHAGGIAPLLDQVLAEAETYRACGLHALMVENMHDVPSYGESSVKMIFLCFQLPITMALTGEPLTSGAPHGSSAVSGDFDLSRPFIFRDFGRPVPCASVQRQNPLLSVSRLGGSTIC